MLIQLQSRAQRAALVCAALLCIVGVWTLVVKLPHSGSTGSSGINRTVERLSDSAFNEELARLGALESAPAKMLQSAVKSELASAPLNSRLWLVLATLSWRAGSPEELVARQLRMSYFTAPNDKLLMRHRLPLVARAAGWSTDLSEVTRREIRTIMLREPELRPVVAAAFRDSTTRGREIIRAVVSEIDPAFSRQLR